MKLSNPIAKGNTADIYLHENKIIKVFKDYLPETESRKEANKQELAYSRGLPVPQVLDVTKIDGKQAIIMEYITGKTLGELFLENKEQEDYYLGLSVDIQRKIHSYKTDKIESMYEKLQKQIEQAPVLNITQKINLISMLQTMNVENALCHGDLHLFNLIMVGERITIIDWVDASSGDFRADVYRTYLLYSQYSIDLANKYVKLYCEKSGIERTELFRWAPIIAAARLSETVSTENTKRLLDIIASSSKYFDDGKDD